MEGFRKAIDVALRAHDLSALTALLESDAARGHDLTHEEEFTPLETAVREFPTAIPLLVARGADPNACCYSGNGCLTPLGLAVDQNVVEAVALLLCLPCVQVDSRAAFTMGGHDSWFQLTALFLTLRRDTRRQDHEWTARTDMARMLLRAGARPYARIQRRGVTTDDACVSFAQDLQSDRGNFPDDPLFGLLAVYDTSVEVARRSVLSLLPPTGGSASGHQALCALLPRDVALLVCRAVWASRGDDSLWLARAMK